MENSVNKPAPRRARRWRRVARRAALALVGAVALYFLAAVVLSAIPLNRGAGRIGPVEIESVIMELPYVLECGVSAAPDEVRGQVVKASVVLTKGTEPTEELKKEIQNYVKQHTAPYKYPRIVVFREDLPKTVSGKIQRALLCSIPACVTSTAGTRC